MSRFPSAFPDPRSRTHLANRAFFSRRAKAFAFASSAVAVWAVVPLGVPYGIACVSSSVFLVYWMVEATINEA